MVIPSFIRKFGASCSLGLFAIAGAGCQPEPGSPDVSATSSGVVQQQPERASAMGSEIDNERITNLPTYPYEEGMMSLGQGLDGVMGISGGCPTVMMDGRSVLLVFPDTLSSIDDSGKAIRMADVSLKVGETVSLLGRALFEQPGQQFGACTATDAFIVSPPRMERGE